MLNSTLSLQQQNAFMDNILERITDAFFAVDKDWRVLLWNKEAENLIQKKKEEVLGKNIWDCFPEAVRLKYYTCYQTALTRQVPIYFEEVYTPLNICTRVSAYPSEDGLSVYFKKVEPRREADMEPCLLAMIAKETINAVTLLNADGTIAWVNDAFTKITGYRFNETIGKKTSALFLGPESDLAAVEDMRQAFLHRLPFQGELLIYTRKKEKKWLSIAGQPLLDVTTKTNKYFLIQTDITEQKKMLRQLETSQKKTTVAIIKAQEKERELIGQELHDNVNQILTTIKLFIEISRSNPEQGETLLPRCSDLIKDVIQETRNISHRLTPPQLEEDRLEDLITTLAGTIRAARQFDLKLNLSGISDVTVPKDIRLAVYRILQEHLMNIIKHADAKRVEIVATLIDEELVIKVVDDGKGFDLTARRSGIGLINIKNRAESMDGSLVINSKPGLGCVLIVRIPIKKESMPAAF